MPEVIITIKKDGSAKVHAEGIQGTACSLHTLPFVAALGEKTGEEPLPEMFMEAVDTLYQEIGGEG
jgi:hypothetical protein